MLTSDFVSGRLPRGTLVAEIGCVVVGAYYALAWRSLKRISETTETPADHPFSPEKTPWPELRYLQWGVSVSVVFFMLAGAADSESGWLFRLTYALLGFCGTLFLAMFGVGFVSLIHLWKELVSQLRKARIRLLLLSFPLAIFWLALGVAVMVVVGMAAEKFPSIPRGVIREALWLLIAMALWSLWMGRSHAALMLRAILMALFSTIVVAAAAFSYWWIIGQTALFMVVFLSAIGVFNVVFYSHWVRYKALEENFIKPPDPG